MVLKLDPRFPIVWRDPASLQIGVDAPQVRLDNLTEAEERMVAALGVGVNRAGLEVIADSCGVQRSRISTLLSALGPALASPPRSKSGSVVVTGTGPTADRVIGTLAESGIRVYIATTVEDAAAADAALAIAIGHFVFPPALYGLWLRRDIPHLPVLLGDDSVRIGPIVEPGRTACLYCFERHRADADPSWPAIASQLLGKRSAIESALVASEVSAVASRLAISRLRGGDQSESAMLLEATSGQISFADCPPHPLCGCSTLEGTDWADVPPIDSAGRPRPRTTKACAAHG